MKNYKKIIFFGLGSIGKRHLRLLQEHFSFDLYRFARPESEHVPGVQSVTTRKDVQTIRPDLAFICNPTEYHTKTAQKCAELGMDLFIEKPLSINYDGIEDLLQTVTDKNLIAYVAYPFRHEDRFEQFKNTTCTLVCTSNANVWPGDRKKDHVVLELSHEIDLSAFINGKIKSFDILLCNDINFYATAIHESNKTGLFLSVDSDVERRNISFHNGDNGQTKVFVYQATDDLYLAQLTNFFNGDYRGNTLQEHIPEFKTILEMRG